MGQDFQRRLRGMGSHGHRDAQIRAFTDTIGQAIQEPSPSPPRELLTVSLRRFIGPGGDSAGLNSSQSCPSSPCHNASGQSSWSDNPLSPGTALAFLMDAEQGNIKHVGKAAAQSQHSSQAANQNRWLGSRGLLPRCERGIPFTLQGKVSEEAVSKVQSRRQLSRPCEQPGNGMQGVTSAEGAQPALLDRTRSELQNGQMSSLELSEAEAEAEGEGTTHCFLFLDVECRGLCKKDRHHSVRQEGPAARMALLDDGTLMTFVVVEVLSDGHKWQFLGHTEVSELGTTFPKFRQAIKLPLDEHLMGHARLSKLRLTVFTSKMRPPHVEQCAHDFAYNAECPICLYHRALYLEEQAKTKPSQLRATAAAPLRTGSAAQRTGADCTAARTSSAASGVQGRGPKAFWSSVGQALDIRGPFARTESARMAKLERSTGGARSGGAGAGVFARLVPLSPAAARAPSAEVVLADTVFARCASVLGLVEVGIEELLARPDQLAVAKDAGKPECTGQRVLRRLGASLEAAGDTALRDNKLWKYRTLQRVGSRLLAMSDGGHGRCSQGDRTWSLFKMFDTGGAGTIDPKEFVQGLEVLGIHAPTKAQAQELFDLVDLQACGEIHYSDFQEWVRGARGAISVKAQVAYEKDRELAHVMAAYAQDLDLRVLQRYRANKAKAGGREMRREMHQAHLGGHGWRAGFRYRQRKQGAVTPVERRLMRRVERHGVGDGERCLNGEAEAAQDATKRKPKSPRRIFTSLVGASCKGPCGVPYFWLSDAPASVPATFKPSHEKLPIQGASPASTIAQTIRCRTSDVASMGRRWRGLESLRQYSKEWRTDQNQTDENQGGLRLDYRPPFEASVGSRHTSGIWIGAGCVSNFDISHGKHHRVIDR